MTEHPETEQVIQNSIVRIKSSKKLESATKIEIADAQQVLRSAKERILQSRALLSGRNPSRLL